MKNKITLSILAIVGFTFTVKAQDTIKTTGDAPLVISGSVDTYFKTDLSGKANIPTSFANENNSISIGMIDLGLKKSVGKASFVGELSFGPRGQQQSIPNADPGLVNVVTPIGENSYAGSGVGYSSYHIQN